MNLTENSYFSKKSMAYGRMGVFNLTMEVYPDKRQRNIRIWLPQEYDGARRFPVIYMHDGQNLFDDEEDRTKWYVDREMEKIRKENISAIIVGIDNASTRISELCPDILPINPEACSICNLRQEEIEPTGSLYAEFITMQLKPWIDQNFQTLTDKKNTIIGGSSMGGLMSFHMLLTYPDIYGNAMVFSPNFIMFKEKDLLKKLMEYDFARLDENKIFIFHGGLGLEDANWPYVRKIFEFMRHMGMEEQQLALLYDSRQPHYETAWRKYFEESIRFLIGKK